MTTETFVPVHCCVCDNRLPALPSSEVVEHRVEKNGELAYIELAHAACKPEWLPIPVPPAISFTKRRFNQAVDVERRNIIDGTMYVAFAPHGITMASRVGPTYLATFTTADKSQSFYLSQTAAEITFKAFHDSWDTQESQELPTTESDRDYKGFDYLAVHNGKLRAYHDAINDEEALVIDTYEQFLHLCAQNEHVLFSSSVDHADEYSDDPAVLALVQRIRG